MTNNYYRLIEQNLSILFASLPNDLDQRISASRENDRFVLNAFGRSCIISPDRITFTPEQPDTDAITGLLVSLYALNAANFPISLTPLKAFKEFPNSMPYAGAFTTHTEQLLTGHVARIKTQAASIMEILGGEPAPPGTSGDFSFVVYPLPKIALCYIFYEADQDFPAGVTCLFSGNADCFMPIDGMADTGEYTSRRIIDIITN